MLIFGPDAKINTKMSEVDGIREAAEAAVAAMGKLWQNIIISFCSTRSHQFQPNNSSFESWQIRRYKYNVIYSEQDLNGRIYWLPPMWLPLRATVRIEFFSTGAAVIVRSLSRIGCVHPISFTMCTMCVELHVKHRPIYLLTSPPLSSSSFRAYTTYEYNQLEYRKRTPILVNFSDGR